MSDTCLQDCGPCYVNVPADLMPDGVTVQPNAPAKPFIWQTYSGNDNTLTAKLTLADGTTPVTPANSLVIFSLAETQFSKKPIWTADWHGGLKEITPGSGVVSITIPKRIMDCLRRGSYMFSVRVSDKLGNSAYTPLIGSMLVEYTVNGPQHDIPYKHDKT